jgi:hypothetical protein
MADHFIAVWKNGMNNFMENGKPESFLRCNARPIFNDNLLGCAKYSGLSANVSCDRLYLNSHQTGKNNGTKWKARPSIRLGFSYYFTTFFADYFLRIKLTARLLDQCNDRRMGKIF